jgi:cell division protein FtsI/penicillin-binding protein 2
MIRNNAISIRFKIIGLAILVLFLALIIRLYHLQITRHDELYKKAKKHYTSTVIKKGTRGEIFDLSGNLLVGNKPCVTICVDPVIVKTKKHALILSRIFARVFQLNQQKLYKKITKKTRKKQIITSSHVSPFTLQDFLPKTSITKNVSIYFNKLTKQYSPLTNKKNVKLLAEDFSYRYSMDKKEFLHNLTKCIEAHTIKKYKVIDAPNRYALITTKVDLQRAKKLKAILKKHKLNSGISFINTTKRFYPNDKLLANVLGFTNKDRDKIIPVVGVERFLNNNMASKKGKIVYERTRTGGILSYGNRKVKNAHDGDDIYLTIEAPIQAIMEEELDKLMEKWHPRAAYAIMVEPQTGNIMAIAQRPTFNPNDRSTMKPDAWRPRFAQDIFDPGSTMKPIAISGAIDNNIVTPETLFDCENGRWGFGGRTLHDAHPMATLSVKDIIKHSSNIGTAKIAIQMGPKLLYTTLRKFGFGERTGISISNETSGIFHNYKKWSKVSISRIPIGQGISVSPLQLVRAYCALANGGNLLDLRLIDRMKNRETQKIKKRSRRIRRHVFKQKSTSQKIIKMMLGVTESDGTAPKAAVPGYSVAGKTGTSQKVENGRYSKTKFFATFIGFVPATRPRFVLLITADEPKKNHYGGTVAAPTFRRISERTLRFLDILPDKKQELDIIKP